MTSRRTHGELLLGKLKIVTTSATIVRSAVAATFHDAIDAINVPEKKRPGEKSEVVTRSKLALSATGDFHSHQLQAHGHTGRMKELPTEETLFV